MKTVKVENMNFSQVNLCKDFCKKNALNFNDIKAFEFDYDEEKLDSFSIHYNVVYYKKKYILEKFKEFDIKSRGMLINQFEHGLDRLGVTEKVEEIKFLANNSMGSCQCGNVECFVARIGDKCYYSANQEWKAQLLGEGKFHFPYCGTIFNSIKKIHKF